MPTQIASLVTAFLFIIIFFQVPLPTGSSNRTPLPPSNRHATATQQGFHEHLPQMHPSNKTPPPSLQTRQSSKRKSKKEITKDPDAEYHEHGVIQWECALGGGILLAAFEI